jgi:hypothetical protein
MFERNLDTGLPCASDKQHWRGVLQRLQLSEQQVKEVCILAYASLVSSHLMPY